MTDNILTRKECWLVQSGVFKDGIAEITGRKSIVRLNYMGSAEFEWGALPKSTCRMLTNIEFYDVFSFPQYTNDKDEVLMAYAPKMFIEHISKIVDGLATGKLNRYLKEQCNLHKHINKEEIRYHYADFWWDIENDFYLFFGDEKKELVLQAQQAMRDRSINDVDVGDWDELSSYYSINNQDLNDEAKAFLKPKKKNSVKRLVKVLNERIDQEQKN